jgi:hypothetical protein
MPVRFTAPCRTFAPRFHRHKPRRRDRRARSRRLLGLTISHAISISNDGVGTASVLVPSGGTGIIISAAVGAIGIQFNTGQSLTIENCVAMHLRCAVERIAPINDAGIHRDRYPVGAAHFSWRMV